MTATSMPDLEEIALRIVSDPSFEATDDGMIRALETWNKLLIGERRALAERMLIARLLQNTHAVYRRDHPAPTVRAVETGPREAVVAEPEPAPEPDDEPAAPSTVLRFSSESDNWSKPPVPAEIGPERFPSPPKRRTVPPPSPRFGPVVISHVAKQRPEPEAPVQRVPVQQDSWIQRRFPSLDNWVTVNGVRKREGELLKNEIPFRLNQISLQRRKHRDDDTVDQERIDQRNRLNERTQRGMRLRAALDRELESEAVRLTASMERLADGVTIAQLGADVLAECGYERRSA